MECSVHSHGGWQPSSSGAAVRQQRHMVSEFDLPCTDCDQDLVARELGEPAATGESLTIAECPSCMGRYYPEETLTRLSFSDPA
jgi:hypothetical protein